MVGKTERVILIKGDSTKWYDQAIFIVNQNMPAHQVPTDFVSEAERIIHNYMRNKKSLPSSSPNITAPVATIPKPNATKTKKTKERTKTDFALNILMMLACMFLVVVLVYGLLS